MLCYVILCIVVFLFLSKYWRSKRPTEGKEESKEKSVLDELEMETNIFQIKESSENGLEGFEIDTPYGDKTADEFLGPDDDDIIDEQIKKLMDD